MHALYSVLLVVAFAMLALGLAGAVVRTRLWLSAPLACLVLGTVTGPEVLAWIEPGFVVEPGSRVMIEVARMTLAIAVISAAIRLPNGYVRRAWRELLWILGPGMLLMAAVAALLAWAVLGWLVVPAALLGAVLAPTDPVLAAAVVTGRLAERCVPARVRHSLTAESGTNDGLALIILLLPASLLWRDDPADALVTWLSYGWLRELGLAALVGGSVGWVTARLYRWAGNRPEADHPSLITVAIALAVLVLAASTLVDTDGLLACFVAGAILNEDIDGEREQHQEHFNEAVGRLLELPFFVVLGAVLPWREWAGLGWRGVCFVVLVLLLRRLPAWLLLRRRLRSLASWQDTFFAGWFGPVGIAAVFYALEWRERVGIADLWPVTSLAVAASILVHGVSSTPATRALGRTRPDRA